MNEEYKNERKRFINKAVIISIIVVFSVIVIGAMTLVAMSLIKNTKTSNGEDISKYMARIEDAIKMVKSKYIDDIDTEKLVDGAVAGIAEATGDPYTRYMDEEEYIQLQTLLAKFRVVAMKEFGAESTPTKIKEKDLKIIRKIDYLRNNTILNLYGGNVR